MMPQDLVVFKDEFEIRRIFNLIGMNVLENGDVYDENGHRAVCNCCEEPITTRNISHVNHDPVEGKNVFLCSAPCFMVYLCELDEEDFERYTVDKEHYYQINWDEDNPRLEKLERKKLE